MSAGSGKRPGVAWRLKILSFEPFTKLRFVVFRRLTQFDCAQKESKVLIVEMLGLPGRLSKGAGTHLASWLQEVSNITDEEALSWLAQPRHPKTEEVLVAVQGHHGSKSLGHSGPVVAASFSGELLATKDKSSMRLWRARDGTLLRVVSACPGNGIAFSPSGSNIVTGSAKTSKVKVWGPAGQSAVGCGNSKITAGKQ